MAKRQLLNISGISPKPKNVQKGTTVILECMECEKEFRIGATYYNRGIRRCGIACFSKGVSKRVRTKEHNLKISLANKGKKPKPWTEEQRLKHIKQRIGIYPHRNKTKEELKEIYRKISESNKKSSPRISGKDHPNWQGGKTSKTRTIRKSLEYKEWRKKVFERDNYTCVWCGDSKGGNLSADHIKPFSLFPELRFDIKNGRTLCLPCHRKTDTWGVKSTARKYFYWAIATHKTPE